MTQSRKSKKQPQKGQVKKQAPKKSKSGMRNILIILVLLVGAFFAWKFLSSPDSDSTSEKNYTPGPANACKFSPSLINAHNLEQPVALDFSQRGFTGMRIIEVREDGSGRILQMPSWDDAGHLGLYALDRKGNVYTTPVPHISLQDNKPEEQNRVYKIDSFTGDMKVFVELPWAKPPSLNNPFGALGVAYDCDNECIYVSSVAGSGPSEELGRIFQVDLETGEILDMIEGIDVIGVGVFTTITGKKLFCGSARQPDIYSIGLNEQGGFEGEPEFVLSLIEQVGGSFDKGQRIRFFEDNRMEIKGIDFNYSLMVASDPLRNIYNFQYDNNSDSWTFLEVYKQ